MRQCAQVLTSEELPGLRPVIVALIKQAAIPSATAPGSTSVPGSLPYEVASASWGVTITFSVDCPSSSPITLASVLDITKTLTIDGPGIDSVVVDGQDNYGIDTPGATLAVEGLSLEHLADIYSDARGSLTVTSSELYDTGINLEGGQVDVVDSTLTHSDIGSWWRMIAYYGTVNVTGSTLSDNNGPYVGGAIFNNGGTVNVTDSTLSGNTSNYELALSPTAMAER